MTDKTDKTGTLNDAEITRYARQLILPEISDEGQDALKATRLAIIGAGGLGNPALMAATNAGFGHITLIDDDVIEGTNLNRQFLFTPDDIAQPKAEIAARHAAAQNPLISVKARTSYFDETIADEVMAGHDIIIDASDNAPTRYLANRTALAHDKPLIFVSAIRFEGQLAVFSAPLDGDERTGCYECLFPQTSSIAPVANCATVGIAGPVTMVMGSLAVLEAIKLVTKAGSIGTSLAGRLMLFDGLGAHSDIIKTKRDKNCPACADL